MKRFNERIRTYDNLSLITEVVGSIFGVLGLGWFYAGRNLFVFVLFVGYLLLLGLELRWGNPLLLVGNLLLVCFSAVKVREYVQNEMKYRPSVTKAVLGGLLGPVLAYTFLQYVSPMIGLSAPLW